MNFDTPYVEYFISGIHTSIWIALVIMDILEISIQTLFDLDAGDAGFVLLFIPLAYIIGTLFSTLAAHALDPIRVKIRNSIFPYERYKDEVIAYLSSDLYQAYTARAHRVSLMGASIFNWLFLALALLFNVGFSESTDYISIIIIPISLSILSAITWYFLVKRALVFRKNAIDIIREETLKKRISKAT